MIILYIIFAIPLTIFTGIVCLFIRKKEYTKPTKFHRRLLNLWAFLIIKIMRIKLDLNGLDKLPKDKTILLVGNHRSNFDPIIAAYVFRKYNIAFISKFANFKIPLFGMLIRRLCYLGIDRENPKNAIRTISKASKLITNNNLSIGVYPEGTRNKDSKDLLTFHDGVFKIAQKANVDVVCIYLDGTEKIHKNYPWKKSIVYLNVVDVINKENVLNLSTHDISQRTKEKLLLEIKSRG